MKSGVYLITNQVNGKVYVGSSISIQCRIQQHRGKLRKNKHTNIHLQAAWNKYGEEAFVFEKLESLPIQFLKLREAYWISAFDACDDLVGYNKTTQTTAPMLGKKHSVETKSKISKRFSGKNHPFYGKKFSIEHVEKLRLSHLGKVLSKETIAKRTEKQSKEYKVIAPNGTVIIFKNLHKFCRDNQLHLRSMYKLFANKRNKHKGYKLI